MPPWTAWFALANTTALADSDWTVDDIRNDDRWKLEIDLVADMLLWSGMRDVVAGLRTTNFGVVMLAVDACHRYTGLRG